MGNNYLSVTDLHHAYAQEGGILDQTRTEYGIRNTIHSTDFNSLAHTQTSAAITIHFDYGAARAAGYGREIYTGQLGTLDSQKDVFNNDVGIRIGDYARKNRLDLDDADIARLSVDALNRGLLVVNEQLDQRLVSARPVYDAPSPEVVAYLEQKYGLPAGSLPVGTLVGPSLPMAPVFPPTTSLRPMVRPDDLTAGQPPECFLSGTLVSFWPEGLPLHFDSGDISAIDSDAGVSASLDANKDVSGATGLFDEALVVSWSISKPIESVEVGDVVVSYDAEGRLRPGRVTRLYRNRVRHVLDVFGLKVTPGHVTLCGDGEFEGRHIPILDILRSDGALVRSDGSKVRAATGCDLGSSGDRMIMAVVGGRQPDGQIKIAEAGEIRAGTRVILETGQDVSVLDLIEANGGFLSEDGYVQTSPDSPKLPFRWTFTPHLPEPEDYVLQCSAITLSEIYEADQWEAVAPRMPIPCLRVTLDETKGQHKSLI